MTWIKYRMPQCLHGNFSFPLCLGSFTEAAHPKSANSPQPSFQRTALALLQAHALWHNL